MDVAGFIAKWSKFELPGRSAAHQHFCDLCELLDQAPARVRRDLAQMSCSRLRSLVPAGSVDALPRLPATRPGPLEMDELLDGSPTPSGRING